MARFSMTDLEEVSLILEMIITCDRSKRTLRISQTDYTRSIMDRFNVKDCNPVNTPSTGAETSLDQPTDALLDEDGVKLYQSMVGRLLYFSRTARWDISYAVLQLTRATSKPSTAHLKKAEHVLRYLKGHQELDIVYRSGNFKLQAFADASSANDPDKRRSTSGYIFLFAGEPISWVSSLQSLTALSTVESELVAITLRIKEACHIQDLLRELKFNGFEKSESETTQRSSCPPQWTTLLLLWQCTVARTAAQSTWSTLRTLGVNAAPCY